ncbi:hypothetical protein [Listeria valentina]|uniref:hypothetical protein n=1 Tax=Listeria valentina TaxID=2705293 RepID=UPI0014312561|nr:hypothetical protein [Listeria valentina]
MTDEEVLKVFEDYVGEGYELITSIAKSEKSGSGEFALKVNNAILEVLSEEEAFEYKCKLISETLRKFVNQ